MTGVVIFLINIHKLGVSSAQGSSGMVSRALYHRCQVCNQSFPLVDLMVIVGNDYVSLNSIERLLHSLEITNNFSSVCVLLYICKS